jgi:hypothetical protein
MKLAERLAAAIAGGVRRIGQVSIEPRGDGYLLRHIDDEGLPASALQGHEDPEMARTISTWADDGHYRFTKGELSLVRGWMLVLSSAGQLKQALDLFYPAGAGLWFAQQDGRIEVEHLRTKLNRQTGMYRFARNLSDAGAQRLVTEVCGHGHCCVKKILWKTAKRAVMMAWSEASTGPPPFPCSAARPATTSSRKPARHRRSRRNRRSSLQASGCRFMYFSTASVRVRTWSFR